MAPLGTRRSSRTESTARPTRSRTKPIASYAEASEEDEDEEDFFASDSASPQPSSRALQDANASDSPEISTRTRRQKPRSTQTASVARTTQRNRTSRATSRKRQRPTSSRSQRAGTLGSVLAPKRRKTSRNATVQATNEQDPIIPVGRIPKWHTLPYGILVQIFQYAAYPLYDPHTFQPTPSSKWLLDVAYLCRDFAEPALTVLFATPPLVPMAQAHNLVALLKMDPRSMKYKYRSKVEVLQIDVDQVAAHTLTGHGLLDLHGLVKDLPRLTALEFYHQKDMAPYRELDFNIKWTYPEALFEALEYVDPRAERTLGEKTAICQLKSWRWSSRMAGKKWSIERMPEIHQRLCFASLQKIAFVNYQVQLLKRDEEDPRHEHIMAEALNKLKNLTHLVFESSTLMNHKLLPLLPKTLRNLELINCWEIIAEDFTPFLLTHGSQLRVLTLNHNQSLSLSFLPILGEACSKLQVLRMNLTYFNVHATYRDSEPQYEQLLKANEIPNWPSTLQIIELTQMRKWQTDAATTFFQSLLDSAGQLRDLRRLSIQAILSIGWRDRATFRDEWVGSLTRVFKRKSNRPEFHYTMGSSEDRAVVSAAASRLQGTEEAINTISDSGQQMQTSTGKASISRPGLGGAIVTVEIPSHSLRDRVKGTSSTPSHDNETVPRSPTKQRSTRRTTRQHTTGKYAETDSEPEVIDVATTPKSKPPKRNAALRELEWLQPSVGYHGCLAKESGTTSASDSGTGTDHKAKRNAKGKEIIQGMCDIVQIRIDNLRPTEHQVTEQDFLDEEKSGDEDWNGDQDDDIGGVISWH